MITSLGDSEHETWERLLAGECAPQAVASRFRLDELARNAAREAVAHSRWTLHPSSGDTAIIVASSKGDVVSWLNALARPAGGCHSACLGLADTSLDLATHLN